MCFVLKTPPLISWMRLFLLFKQSIQPSIQNFLRLHFFMNSYLLTRFWRVKWPKLSIQFPCGSAGGPEGTLPDHCISLICKVFRLSWVVSPIRIYQFYSACACSSICAASLFGATLAVGQNIVLFVCSVHCYVSDHESYCRFGSHSFSASSWCSIWV